MNNWIKLIGSSEKPIAEHPFYGFFNEEYVGFRKARMSGIRKGDQLFLYAPGGSRSIFALAEAIADPEHDIKYDPKEEGSCRWKLHIRYLTNLPVASGISIDEVSSGQRSLTHSVRQQSHIRLSPEEYKLVYGKMEEKAGK
jgi:hypothetical protein